MFMDFLLIRHFVLCSTASSLTTSAKVVDEQPGKIFPRINPTSGVEFGKKIVVDIVIAPDGDDEE